MNILDAIDDPLLFGQHFRGDSWSPWRAFLAALFGIELSDAPGRDLSRMYGPR